MYVLVGNNNCNCIRLCRFNSNEHNTITFSQINNVVISPCQLILLENTDLTKFKRQRNRVILGGESCGPVFEEESCQVPDAVCPKYFWVLGGWSYCQLAEGVTCGHGLRTRGAFLY